MHCKGKIEESKLSNMLHTRSVVGAQIGFKDKPACVVTGKGWESTIADKNP